MKNEFIPYEQALALKELGFDEECFGLYHNDKTFYPTQCKSHKQFYGQICSAPLYQQVFKFFRIRYNLYSYIEPVLVEQAKSKVKFDYVILEEDKEEEIEYYNKPFHTYEEAELACLNKLIEIVKNYKK